MSSYEQVKELIQKSKKILLITRQNPCEDSISSLLAFGFVLEKMGKEIDMVTSGPILPTLSFLPKTSNINNNLQSSRNFIISLDTSAIKVSQLSYDFDKDGNRLNIYISPQGGAFKPEHIKTKDSGYGYDAIIILDSLDLDMLDEIYHKNTPLFFETPIINIDWHSSNKNYGEVNLIDLEASSCAEILYPLFKILGENLIDKNIATSLLVGVVGGTKSFQSPKTTSRAFDIAAKLIALGADQQKIINHIFKNKTLSTLQLWGRAFARVQYSQETKFAWTLITLQDFQKTAASFENLRGLEEELSASLSDSEIFLILSEREQNKIEGLIRVNDENLKKLLAQELKINSPNGLLDIQIDGKNLIEAEKEIVTKIKKIQSRRINNL